MSTNNEFAELLAKQQEIQSIKENEISKVTITHIGRKLLIVSYQDQFTGIISGSDLISSILDVRALKVGDEIEAMFRGQDRESGLFIFSLRKASQVQLIDKLNDKQEASQSMTVVPTEANKGGLLVDLDGMKGFIPVSQLSPMNYPRVEGADPEKILAHLNGLVGKPLEVRVLNVDEGGKKIIFSEKATVEDRRKLALDKLKEGDIVEGQVSGILSYGLFVTFDGLEGLVHVSEVDWGHVADPSKFAKVGDNVTVQVIGVDTDKISLSMKRLKENPWDALAKQFNVGDVVEVPVTKISKFGVFVEMTGGINGLIHLSEITHEVVANPADHVKMGEVVKAKIIALDTTEKRIGLSLKALVPAPVPVVEEGVTTEKNENDLLGDEGEQLKAAEKAVAKEESSEEVKEEKPKKAPAKKTAPKKEEKEEKETEEK